MLIQIYDRLIQTDYIYNITIKNSYPDLGVTIKFLNAKSVIFRVGPEEVFRSKGRSGTDITSVAANEAFKEECEKYLVDLITFIQVHLPLRQHPNTTPTFNPFNSFKPL